MSESVRQPSDSQGHDEWVNTRTGERGVVATTPGRALERLRRLFRDPAPQVRDGGYQPTRDPGPPPEAVIRRKSSS